MTISSTLQFPNSHILNHRIIVASFVGKGSHTEQAIRYDGLFSVYLSVRLVASFDIPITTFSEKMQSSTLSTLAPDKNK